MVYFTFKSNVICHILCKQPVWANTEMLTGTSQQCRERKYMSRIPPKVAPLRVRVTLGDRRRRSTSCHRSLFPFRLFLSNCFHLFLVGVLGRVLFKFVLPAGVCAGLLVVTFGDVSCFGCGFFAVQCVSRFWVGFSASVLGIHPCFGPVTI